MVLKASDPSYFTSELYVNGLGKEDGLIKEKEKNLVHSEVPPGI